MCLAMCLKKEEFQADRVYILGVFKKMCIIMLFGAKFKIFIHKFGNNPFFFFAHFRVFDI